ncbi:MAG: FTR1 family iron permease [Solirubrobacteraceae bacterium]
MPAEPGPSGGAPSQAAPAGRDVAGRSPRRGSQRGLYIWTGVVLAVCVTAVILGWHAHGGTPDPTDAANQMSPTTAVINSGVLVFREGLETILVLAAITASFLGANRAYRKPVAIGGGLALLAAIVTWFLAIWVIGMFGGDGLAVQAATGIPAIIVLLLVMNWFFHKLYWTGWISHHHKRRRGLLGSGGGEDGTLTRAALLGLGLLGFTSVYREGFEIVIFLQGLRERFGASVVLEGVVLGLLFTAAVGVLTFSLHQRLPYKKLLIVTGAMLVVVLWVMVGEEVNEMQLAGWIGTTPIPGLSIPGWAGTWFSVFPNVETIAAQLVSLVLVLGSYVAAQYVRIWRPRRQGEEVARRAEEPPVSERSAERPGAVVATPR